MASYETTTACEEDSSHDSDLSRLSPGDLEIYLFVYRREGLQGGEKATDGRYELEGFLFDLLEMRFLL